MDIKKFDKLIQSETIEVLENDNSYIELKMILSRARLKRGAYVLKSYTDEDYAHMREAVDNFRKTHSFDIVDSTIVEYMTALDLRRYYDEYMQEIGYERVEDIQQAINEHEDEVIKKVLYAHADEKVVRDVLSEAIASNGKLQLEAFTTKYGRIAANIINKEIEKRLEKEYDGNYKRTARGIEAVIKSNDEDELE